MSLPVIATPRLILRPFTPEDLDALHALWTDPWVRRYLWDDVLISRDRAAEALRSALAAARDGIGHWTLRAAPDGPVIGDCGFQFVDQSREIELMCCLLRPFWGRGLASEACRAALEYLWASTSFERVHARADLPNQDSIRLMRRLGMSHESAGSRLVSYVLARPVQRSLRGSR